MKNIYKLVLFVLLCQLAGVIGSFFTFSEIPTWYAAINKPSFAPPNSVFGPVWGGLYTLMGIAMYYVYQNGWENKAVKNALIFFTVHLAVNSLWSIVFFGLHAIGAALGVIILLWGMIAVSIYLFGRLSKSAAFLLIPYLLWVSFATYLNYSFWVLNK